MKQSTNKDKPITIVVSKGVFDRHRAKVKEIISYVVGRYGLGHDFISGTALSILNSSIDMKSDAEIEDVYNNVIRILNEQ